MFKRLGLVGAGVALSFAGYQEVTAPTIELSAPTQTACSEEITTAVNACRANALAFNTSTDPKSSYFQAREEMYDCLNAQGTQFAVNCSAPDPFFPAHFYVGEYPKQD